MSEDGGRMNICFQMVGIPGSGKSTWIKNREEFFKDWVIVSTDAFVEEYAKSIGKTYSEVFEDYMPTAVELMTQQVIEARSAGKNIVWDQTSTTINSRKKKFKMLPDYEHHAIVLHRPPMEVLKQRLSSRPGKNIPDDVISGMLDSFQVPTTDEGFITISSYSYV